MVSFWPWSGDSNSPASFEKTLSTLSAKITESQARLDRTRASSRRVRVLATLYLSFAYLVYAIILLVVVGYPYLGAYEWTVLCGGPVLIYVVRTVLTSLYAFRIDALATRLKDQTAEREKTIQKLKDATKYDSTLKLIEKYGGDTPEKKKKKKEEEANAQKKKQQAANQGSPQRTRMPPPATANIQRPQQSGSQQPASSQQGHRPGPDSREQQEQEQQPTEEFAPNAYSSSHPPPPPPHSQQQLYAPESHWYDRVFDVLLGEDEAAAKNRIVLLCQNCKLVNGQAPPGTKSLAEVGMWRCMACHATNGEEDEGQRIVKEVLSRDNKESDGDNGEAADTEPVFVDAEDETDDGNVRQRKFDKGAASDDDS